MGEFVFVKNIRFILDCCLSFQVKNTDKVTEVVLWQYLSYNWEMCYFNAWTNIWRARLTDMAAKMKRRCISCSASWGRMSAWRQLSHYCTCSSTTGEQVVCHCFRNIMAGYVNNLDGKGFEFVILKALSVEKPWKFLQCAYICKSCFQL